MDSGRPIERVGYLPGLAAKDVEWQTLRFGGAGETLEIAVPVLNNSKMKAMASRVRDAASRQLKTLPIAQIVEIIDHAIARLLDRQDPYRQKAEALLPIITGYDAEMIRLGLTGYLKTFRKPELHKFLVEDFTNPQILDSFQPIAKGGVARAYGPDILAHIWAGNVPGLPLWSLISGLLVKAGNIGKVPSSEPLFAGLFAKLLAEIEPSLADCFAIVWWKGGETVCESVLLDEADVILAYGDNDTLATIRERVPVTTRYLTHGHKISFGMISRATLDKRKVSSIAHRAAYDIVRYDQHGCYSPQFFFIERGGAVSPRDFCGYLAYELACFERKFPRRPLTIDELHDVASWRHREEFKASSEPGHEITGDAEGAWTVVYTESEDYFAPSGLNRTIKIVAIESLTDVVSRIVPYKAFLQTVGIAAPPEELYSLADKLGKAGVTRISALGHMTAPEAGWHHDGRFNLVDLITLTEIERSAEAEADGFAIYVD